MLAIARRGSFRAAALDLGMSTTALSNAIAQAGGEPRRAPVQPHHAQRLAHAMPAAPSSNSVGPALQEIHAAMEAVRSQQATPSGTLRINAFADGRARDPLAAGPGVPAPLSRRCMSTWSPKGGWSTSSPRGSTSGVRVADLVPSDMIAVPLGRPQRYAVVGLAGLFRGAWQAARPARPPRHTTASASACRTARSTAGTSRSADRAAQIDVTGPITLDEASLARTAVLEGVGHRLLHGAGRADDIAAGRLLRLWTTGRRRRRASASTIPGGAIRRRARAFLALAREIASRPPGRLPRRLLRGCWLRIATGRGFPAATALAGKTNPSDSEKRLEQPRDDGSEP